MHKHQLGPRDGVIVEQEAGKDIMGDNVPGLHVSISELHSVGINDGPGSHMLVRPLRLADGTLRPRMDVEPEFHPDAHYLIRITGPSMTSDKYHQFDRDGNYLK